MNQAINIDNINVEYLPDNELNVDATLSNIYQTHKSLEPLNALMNAYQTAHDLAAKQTDVRVPVDGLVSFYNQEIQDTQLKLKQQRQRLEMMTRASIAQLQTLKANIVLDQENIDKMKQVYDNATKLYEVGMSTYSDLENTRLKLLQLNLKLASDQKDYLITAKKFELFKQGAFLVSQNNSSSGSSTGSSSGN
ncbi:MAG TPA: TolC family protein, partial [Thermoanaerobacter sp.]|nr:TolC family protein [Thermoanaerobacter sp.]